MRRLLFVTMSTVLLSSSVLAQQRDGGPALQLPSQSAKSKTNEVRWGEFFIRSPKIIRDFSYRPHSVLIPFNGFDDAMKEIKEPEFKLINGRVYISILGGAAYLPMVGGGASGCFTLQNEGAMQPLLKRGRL